MVHSVASGPYLDPPSDFGDTPRGGTKNGNLPVRMGDGPENKNGYQNLPALDPHSQHYINNNNNNNNNNNGSSVHGRVTYSAVAGVLKAFDPPPLHAGTMSTSTTTTTGLTGHAQSSSGVQLSDKERVKSVFWYSIPEASPKAKKKLGQVEIKVQSPSGKYAELIGPFSPTSTSAALSQESTARFSPTPIAVPVALSPAPTAVPAALSPTPTFSAPVTLSQDSSLRGIYDHLERKKPGLVSTPSSNPGVGVADESWRHHHPPRSHLGSHSFDEAEVTGGGSGGRESTSRGWSLPPHSDHTHSLSQPIDHTHQVVGHAHNPSWNVNPSHGKGSAPHNYHRLEGVVDPSAAMTANYPSTSGHRNPLPTGGSTDRHGNPLPTGLRVATDSRGNPLPTLHLNIPQSQSTGKRQAPEKILQSQSYPQPDLQAPPTNHTHSHPHLKLQGSQLTSHGHAPQVVIRRRPKKPKHIVSNEAIFHSSFHQSNAIAARYYNDIHGQPNNGGGNRNSDLVLPLHGGLPPWVGVSSLGAQTSHEKQQQQRRSLDDSHVYYNLREVWLEQEAWQEGSGGRGFSGTTSSQPKVGCTYVHSYSGTINEFSVLDPLTVKHLESLTYYLFNSSFDEGELAL